MHNDILETFGLAATIDESIAPLEDSWKALRRKRIAPIPYTRESLFKNMADGKVSIFKDFPSPFVTRGRPRTQSESKNIACYLQSCGTQRKHRVRTGPSETCKYYGLDEIFEKWSRGRAILSATDIHIRDTDIERVIDPAVLSRFNILCDCDDAAASLEMMTMVVSSRGNLTDSHSDDSDGSNHCFVGRKLWLAWDTHDGQNNGLQDVERNQVRRKAKFDLRTFLSLPSACWFVVEEGQTLFFPGHLTHKVVTLEHYVGVGSFYVSLPNCLRTLSRWLLHKPNWTREAGSHNQYLISDLTARIRSRYEYRQKSRSRLPDPWGMDYLPYSLLAWKRGYSAADKSKLLGDPDFSDCFDVACRAAKHQPINTYAT